jgi:hypothetical protein
MSVGSTMKLMGRSAREKAETMSHDMKDRALEKRLDRATEESERLRFENDLLRDEVSETRNEHRRILDLLESRLSEPTEVEVETGKKKSHWFRRLLFLGALGGGAYYWFKQRMGGGSSDDEWTSQMSDLPTVSESGTTTL